MPTDKPHTYTPDSQGLYAKYQVRNQKGERVFPVFVLRPEDPVATKPLLQYSSLIEHHNPALSKDLSDLVDEYSPNVSPKEECVCDVCGGTRLVFTANVIWDPVLRGFEVDYVWDDVWCSDCDSEVRVTWTTERG